ncbi:MAG: hypothetical protein GW939_00015 [Candidatus Magasanikbacteria bacterium]|uniref:Uncharacterized protein n=1 Tax=Candidatus Magasanikbacteria bacterium CG10_big_fil_rev_8_21_14_0_10_38_6 TaxID=1974647 RepID=A0A2M6P1E3_9BACT|nr:hypothetical protein [Candidatus Magasanikbacteria bacterium]NCS71691.1 hypothetical protein [Candidatus Magasanikbacteria bacterium]PIR77536.1 MAG: hypothetical protein COU30_01905 [Candidatus Magasanikbacteria bacterium CG10_big_fil_rev_8_21_14_0_10_38_6]
MKILFALQTIVLLGISAVLFMFITTNQKAIQQANQALLTLQSMQKIPVEDTTMNSTTDEIQNLQETVDFLSKKVSMMELQAPQDQTMADDTDNTTDNTDMMDDASTTTQGNFPITQRITSSTE